MRPLDIMCGVAAVFLVVYYYLTSNFDFWKLRGIRGPRPKPGFGNFKDIILSKQAVGDYLMKMYNDYKDESMIGMFSGMVPILIVKNPELIKDILIKDFSKFAERGISVGEKVRKTNTLINII